MIKNISNFRFPNYLWLAVTPVRSFNIGNKDLNRYGCHTFLLKIFRNSLFQCSAIHIAYWSIYSMLYFSICTVFNSDINFKLFIKYISLCIIWEYISKTKKTKKQKTFLLTFPAVLMFLFFLQARRLLNSYRLFPTRLHKINMLHRCFVCLSNAQFHTCDLLSLSPTQQFIIKPY